MNMKHEVTAKRLREAMANKGMIAQDLAERSGVSKASISQYINGSHKPSNLSAGRMAEVLGVDPLWLMGFEIPLHSFDASDLFPGASMLTESIPQNNTERMIVIEFRKADKTTQDIICKILGIGR